MVPGNGMCRGRCKNKVEKNRIVGQSCFMYIVWIKGFYQENCIKQTCLNVYILFKSTVTGAFYPSYYFQVIIIHHIIILLFYQTVQFFLGQTLTGADTVFIDEFPN